MHTSGYLLRSVRLSWVGGGGEGVFLNTVTGSHSIGLVCWGLVVGSRELVLYSTMHCRVARYVAGRAVARRRPGCAL